MQGSSQRSVFLTRWHLLESRLISSKEAILDGKGILACFAVGIWIRRDWSKLPFRYPWDHISALCDSLVRIGHTFPQAASLRLWSYCWKGWNLIAHLFAQPAFFLYAPAHLHGEILHWSFIGCDRSDVKIHVHYENRVLLYTAHKSTQDTIWYLRK